ncbi:MAG: carboxylating nicotinate-nucleotide diphosphorylase [Methanocorpusculum sp.]|nr:carboxylating nicotinate-nucleotide diphosphorylase [Methanocorpusculum sp.]MDD2470771.1 carboxylating nicotinate-nucleotide diphosphorylase [Methanocorpusculum sp.]MDD3256633.1 carboxylating nicotinate-nucleotide diphosphorylase [Methanocorpusculum sp.]MDD4133393.1 carboxylating nicotinate-nucleotide diphosphorylase [Methanocorpusculum sp.]
MIPTDQLLSFVAEDVSSGDITTLALLENTIVSARIEAREDMVVSGVEECVWLFENAGVHAVPEIMDGAQVKSGGRIISLKGPVHAILSRERTCLNLLGRMSGIASGVTKANHLVSVVNDHVRVAGTRKTAPGLRYFDKKAIVAGGGLPHRYDLSDQFLIKDTHRSFLPVDEAVRRAKAYSDKKVECEVESLEDALLAARAGADILMFDNMTPDKIREAISALKSAGLREKVTLEISGGITPDTVGRFAGLDVDVISMGSLTHSVVCADVSLEIEL